MPKPNRHPATPIALVLFATLTACSTPSAMKSDPVAEYQSALAAAEQAPAPSAEARRAGVERFTEFFRDVTAESVRAKTRTTYAPDAYLNDTLKTVRGADAIEEYFLETAKNTRFVRATVQEVAEADQTTYVRWVMDVQFAAFRKGETIRTIGVTQLRFDTDGRILIHQDFWDPAAGFYEHLPVLGPAIRWIKSKF